MKNSLSNWQDALNDGLVNRLTRPLRQPGMMNMGMGQRIINRCDRFLTRLPLLNQQMQRWSNTNTLSSESIPIVYAQPISLTKEQNIENRVHNFQPIVSQEQPAATIIQRKLDSSQSLPTRTVSNIISVENNIDLSTNLSNSDLADETTEFLSLERQINQTSISASEISVVPPLPNSEQLLTRQEMGLADLTESSTSSPTQSELNVSHPSQQVDATSISASEIPVVSPLPNSEQLLTRQEMGLASLTESPTSSPTQSELNVNHPSQQVDATSILASEIPVVSPFPNYPNQNATLINTQPVNFSNSKINQNNNKKNISLLPVITVISPSNPSLKPQSSPLPLAKATLSPRSNSQQPNLSNRNSISNTDSSSSPRNFASSLSPIETSVSPIATRNGDIDVNAIASQVERKLMRKLVIESERRGKNR